MIVDFSRLELNKLSPIYAQIIRYIKMEIVSEQVQNGDEMPSRRILSTMLSVNPNTVQKAYRQMEEEGLLISYAGSKSILYFDQNRREAIKRELIYHETMKYIQTVKGMGLPLNQVKDMLTEQWDIDFKGEDDVETL